MTLLPLILCLALTGCSALTAAQQVSQIGERQGHEKALEQHDK